MEGGNIERRRGRRVNLGAPLLIRRLGDGQPGPFKQQVAKNVSLAGVYFETESDERYAINDACIASVSVPEVQRREFPFSRVSGPGRVVRVTELPPQAPSGKKRLGIALEFGDATTALTATPPRG